MSSMASLTSSPSSPSWNAARARASSSCCAKASRLHGELGPRMPRFSDLFMLLIQMGIAPDVKFLSYQSVTRYSGLDEALADARALVGDSWDDAIGRAMLEDLL